MGADRIARTAHAALHLLQDLRHRTGAPIPLAWHPEVHDVEAIEVYPAATLKAHGIDARGYKKPSGVAHRLRLLNAASQRLTLPADCAPMLDSDDALDAVLCVLAAHDFLCGRATPPPDRELAEREGWMWIPTAAGRN